MDHDRPKGSFMIAVTGDHRKALLGAGLPPPVVELLVDSDQAIARGELDTTSRELHRLIGGSTKTVKDVLPATQAPRQ